MVTLGGGGGGGAIWSAWPELYCYINMTPGPHPYTEIQSYRDTEGQAHGAAIANGRTGKQQKVHTTQTNRSQSSSEEIT